MAHSSYKNYTMFFKNTLHLPSFMCRDHTLTTQIRHTLKYKINHRTKTEK